MDEKKHRFSGKPVSEQIVNYYLVNDISKIHIFAAVQSQGSVYRR
jgi:hypothetical protein